ncbi:hypothetical protein OIU79_007904 [Salix purpurea]|nr:hypothetical protein OIU79_007904 [Salix purpurea]
MGEGQEKMLQSPCTARRNDDSYEKHKDQWVILGVGGGGGEDDTGNTSSLDNPSSTNGSTASSLDMVDDDASSCSSSNSNGPLFELSELLSHLPIK